MPAEIVLVALAAIGLAVCVARLPAVPPARGRRRPAPEPPRPAQLVELERLAVTAATSAVHAHAYLRPRLAEIAAHRLAARGQALDRMPEASGAELFGDRLWDLIRPDRPFPEDRYGPGVPSQDLAAMLEVLEQL